MKKFLDRYPTWKQNSDWLIVEINNLNQLSHFL